MSLGTPHVGVDRGRKGAFDAPALDPRAKSAGSEAEFCRPIGKQHRPTVKGQAFNSPGVASLFGHRDPLAIHGFVISVVVDAIKRATKWALTHIGNEVSKVRPSFANAYAASAVERVILRARIATSLEHSGPYRVLRRLVHTVSLHPAAAGLGMPPLEIRASYNALAPTVASASPYRPTVNTAGARSHHKSAKTLSGQIDWSHMEILPCQ